MLLEIALTYFLIISLLSAILTVVDKLSAMNGGWRISERTLIAFALLGGGLAMYAVMRIIRHKTKHNKFMIGLPIIIAVQALLIFSMKNIFY